MDQFIISQNVTPDHSAAFNVIAMGKMLFLLGTGCDANTLRWCELCFITITYLTDMTDIGSLTGSWEWCAIVTPSPGTGNTTWLFVQVRIKRVGHHWTWFQSSQCLHWRNNKGMVCYGAHSDLNNNHNYYLLLSQELMFSCCLLLSYGKQSLLSVSVCVQRGN